MKQSIIYTSLLLGAVSALPANLAVREVPQEHAHQKVLDQIDALLGQNNPDKIQSSVFGLLGAAAGIKGAGNIKDADCLQQATADQAFTNAKAANDIAGMTAALIYRGLERNTGSVGLASVPCKSIQAVNPEIAAIQQHQDPASTGAAATNKAITLEIAKQIASIGGNPLDALEAGTFAPGQIGDPTAKGNTCDDANDKEGCINTLKLRVDDATPEEIQAAAGGAGAAANSTGATGVAAAAGNATESVDCADAGNADAGNAANNGNANNGNAKKGKANKGKANNGNANNGNAGQAAAGAGAADAAAAGGAATGGAAGAAAGGANDFGSCTNPTIKFGIPSDGRKEDAFEAADLTNFPHGSALNIKVISSFICDQLVNKCKASAAAVTTCDKANAASANLKGQAAADAFNSALGL